MTELPKVRFHVAHIDRIFRALVDVCGASDDKFAKQHLLYQYTRTDQHPPRKHAFIGELGPSSLLCFGSFGLRVDIAPEHANVDRLQKIQKANALLNEIWKDVLISQ